MAPTTARSRSTSARAPSVESRRVAGWILAPPWVGLWAVRSGGDVGHGAVAVLELGRGALNRRPLAAPRRADGAMEGDRTTPGCVVRAEFGTERVADLADRAVRGERRRASAGAGCRCPGRPPGPPRGQPRPPPGHAPRAAAASGRPVAAPPRGRAGAARPPTRSPSSAKRLTPTMTRSPLSRRARVSEGRVLDLALHEPRSIAGTAPPSSSTRSISSRARSSSSCVSDSTK